MTDHFNTAPGMPQTRAEVNRLDNDTLTDFMGRCVVEPSDFDNCLACYAYQVAQMREAEQATPLWREPGGYRSTCPVCTRLVVDHHGAEAWECLDKMGKVWNDVDKGHMTMITPPEHYEELIRKLIQAGVEYTPARDDKPGDLAGFDAHGQVTLEKAEELLLRHVLDGGDHSIIGRDSFLMEVLAKFVLKAVHTRHPVTRLRNQRRGYWFEVQVSDEKDQPTGHIARVTVELDRLEQP